MRLSERYFNNDLTSEMEKMQQHSCVEHFITISKSLKIQNVTMYITALFSPGVNRSFQRHKKKCIRFTTIQLAPYPREEMQRLSQISSFKRISMLQSNPQISPILPNRRPFASAYSCRRRHCRRPDAAGPSASSSSACPATRSPRPLWCLHHGRHRGCCPSPATSCPPKSWAGV